MVLQCKKDKFFTSNKIALSSGSSLGSEQDASQSGILLVIASWLYCKEGDIWALKQSGCAPK